MLLAECGPPICLFQMLQAALKCVRFSLPCCFSRQTADSGHRGHVRSSCWSLRSYRFLCEDCTNWRVMWDYIHCCSWCWTSSNPQMERILPSRRSGWHFWGVTSLTSLWCLEFVQIKAAVPAAVDPKPVYCWRAACQHFSNRIRLVKEAITSLIGNEQNWISCWLWEDGKKLRKRKRCLFLI